MTYEIPDVDFDVKDRDNVVSIFDVVRASILSKGDLVRHKDGVYFQNIPIDPQTGLAVFPYDTAEELGYYKIDFLPNHVYDGLTSADQIDQILEGPIDWSMFENVDFVRKLFHFGGRVDSNTEMAEVVAAYAPKSVDQLALLIAIKLPAKKHLIGSEWDVLEQEMWTKSHDKLPQFKKSHSIAYALTVIVHAVLSRSSVDNH